ncbi:NAD(P)-binding protein [Streptomyces sp. TS71-3]|uniref:NAD-binding protein n=1 Tax=Streptomyces sp. TS71-3 TaxID=2733862 RepID=UPI001B0C6FD5|nr:NAD(P)-binding protein [Streptomyces sp. TS71-3]GHJ35972.1 potassium transporter TrkA [Streptomyces sp. TS71-3]
MSTPQAPADDDTLSFATAVGRTFGERDGGEARGHMVVWGDNALAQRLIRELAAVYGQDVTVVLPSLTSGHGPRIAQLVRDPRVSVRAVEALEPDERALREAGIETATALALTSGDDQANIHVALRARRINPEVRLVIRLFNRALGHHVEGLLDRAVKTRNPTLASSAVDVSTTVLSDAETAAPSLVAAAVVGDEKIIHADGMLLRAKERTLATAGRRDPLATLALLPDSAGESDERAMGEMIDGPQILPDEDTVAAAAPERGAVVLEAVTPSPGPLTAVTRLPRLPLRLFLSRRLGVAFASVGTVVVVLAAVNWYVSRQGSPLHAVYTTLLDVFAINDPAVGQPAVEQILQLLCGLAGMMFLPLLLAAVLEAYGKIRASSGLTGPPRNMSGHVVLIGLGKVGTRVLARLLELEIPVVCVERDPRARGVPLARAHRVPTVVGDVSEPGVMESSRIERARALMALTSDDATNLEAVLNARHIRPDVRVVMRLFDDDFAATVYGTLRDAYPTARTRSRSVSALAAPAFGGAMMGREVLGAIPVGRRVLIFSSVEVAGNPLLEGRRIAKACVPGAWRVLALDTARMRERRSDLMAILSGGSGTLSWRPDPDRVLKPGDRVVVAATRRGLGNLMHAVPGPEVHTAG